MTDTAEEVTALSDDVDAGEVDEGTVSPTPVTVPKKRGRPASSEKPKKAASVPGRGRGRPAKISDGVNKKPSKTATSADGSEEEGTESDDGSPVFNGDSADGATAVASKRGRKPKSKRKVSNSIESTGKGRGRPKKAKTDDGDDDEVADDDDGDADHKSGKKSAAKGGKKGRGRPKKVNNSDDESSDDKEERRPVGRPSSGSINLNIVNTGNGKGRPKASAIAKRAAKVDKNDKKRGRPSTTGKGAYSPTGKPRGRPKAILDNGSQNEEDDVEDNTSKADENSADNGEAEDLPNGE